jgi:hypothetical protein
VCEYENKLVITGTESIPIEISNGSSTLRDDLKTMHEEADVIIVQQISKLASTAGITSIKVISDYTDVFRLLDHFYSVQKLACNLVMAGPLPVEQ